MKILSIKKTPLAVWHDWFAWHPVLLDNGDVLWLETVRRFLDSRGDYTYARKV